MKRFILFGLMAAIGVVGCNKVDDVMLGKDNTKQPTPLVDFKPSVTTQPKWTSTTGKGSKGNYLKITPAIQGNTIYSADATGTVVALNRMSGASLWKVQLSHGLVSGPAVAGNYVAVAGVDAQVSVLDSKNGKILWTKIVSNEVLAPPVIAFEKVLAKTVDGNLYAFDARSGKKIWKYEHTSPGLILRTGSSPQVNGHLVVVGFSDGRLVGLDLNNGSVLWERDIALPQGSSDVERMVDIDANPIISNNVVYVATYHGYAVAQGLNTGELVWRHKISTFSNMALTPSYLIIADSKDNVWAFDRRSGGVIWRQKQLQGRGLTAPAIFGKTVIIADAEGFVHYLDINDGHFVARASVAKAAIYATPLVIANTAYVLNSAGTLAAYEVRS